MHKSGRLHRQRWLAGLLALCGLTATKAASIGQTFGIPHIRGQVRSGDLDQVRRAFEAGFGAKPLRIDIAPGSDDLELLRIGRWLRERRPAMELRGDCIGACASYILPAAGTLRIRPGTVIALSSFEAWPRHLQQQLDQGALFTAAGTSRASRQRFLDRIAPLIERSRALDAAATGMVGLPESAQAFLDALTAPAGLQHLAFDTERFSLSFALSRHRCLWWVPDAEGLRQLGLDVAPGYQPPDAARIAQRLKKQGQAYVGPALTPLPAQPLCGGGAVAAEPELEPGAG